MIVTNQRGNVKVSRCFQAIKWIIPRWTGDLDVVRELRKIGIGDWVEVSSGPLIGFFINVCHIFIEANELH